MNKRYILTIFLVIIFSSIWLENKYNLSMKINNIGTSPSDAVYNLFQILKKDGLSVTLKKIKTKLSNDPRLGLNYSLADTDSYPSIESAEERESLPETWILQRSIAIGSLPKSNIIKSEDVDWFRSNGGNYSSKYSSLNQINIDNIKDLELAWIYSNYNLSGQSTDIVRTNPIFTNGWLFTATLKNEIACFNASTGDLKWKVKLPGTVAKRGLTWEKSENFLNSRILVPTSDGIFALSANTGEIQKDFGSEGQIGNQASFIPPIVTDDKIIIAIISPAVEAYDKKTGKLIWSTSLIKEDFSEDQVLLTGGVPWGGMSYDSLRSQVYISTGNPRPEIIGVTRPGDNKHSSSIIAISSKTGKILWDFQEVAHDLWDLDIASTPILTTIVRNNRKVDVVATVTKTGNTILLDRDFGQPIFDIPYKKTPTSYIPGERTSSYQPNFELPEPFLPKEFDKKQITQRSQSAYDSVLKQVDKSVYGFFQPPILGKNIILYGIEGGASWPGASVDSRTGTLYVPSSQKPFTLRAEYIDLKANTRKLDNYNGHNLYKEYCSSCHGDNRMGKPKNHKIDQNFVPSLIGITFMYSIKDMFSRNFFYEDHQDATYKINDSELMSVYSYLKELDLDADSEKVIGMRGYWKMLLDDEGNPGNKPPWDFITAIDLNTGKHKWRVPFGEIDPNDLYNKPKQGQHFTASVMATAGDIIFASGIADKKIKALDSTNGNEVWSYDMPSSATSPALTFMHEGIQYIVIVASGLVRDGAGKEGDHLLAFKLSDKNLKNTKMELISSINSQSSIKESNLSGVEVYKIACASCHNSGVANSPMINDPYSWVDRVNKGNDELYKNSIYGYSGKSGYMPAKGGYSSLTDKQVRDAVDYMLGLINGY